jgi:hypothetical protein
LRRLRLTAYDDVSWPRRRLVRSGAHAKAIITKNATKRGVRAPPPMRAASAPNDTAMVIQIRNQNRMELIISWPPNLDQSGSRPKALFAFITASHAQRLPPTSSRPGRSSPGGSELSQTETASFVTAISSPALPFAGGSQIA